MADETLHFCFALNRIKCDGIRCGDQSPEYWGDAVLLTTTAEVGTTIEWVPPLSRAKNTAMRKVHYTSSTKVR